VVLEKLHPAAFTSLVHDRLRALGWDHGEPIALAGASLGAAIAMRYTRDHPGRVERLTLVAPAGLSEPWFHPTNYAGRLSAALVAALPTALTTSWPLNGKLHLVETTPSYGLMEAEVVALARSLGRQLSVYTAGLDIVHSPHSTFWRGLGEAHGCSYTKFALASHWALCLGLFEAGFHKEERLWHEPRAPRERAQDEAPPQRRRYDAGSGLRAAARSRL
jgi:pimeloyl-ACP methyl ester carboxylesterase